MHARAHGTRDRARIADPMLAPWRRWSPAAPIGHRVPDHLLWRLPPARWGGLSADALELLARRPERPSRPAAGPANCGSRALARHKTTSRALPVSTCDARQALPALAIAATKPVESVEVV